MKTLNARNTKSAKHIITYCCLSLINDKIAAKHCIRALHCFWNTRQNLTSTSLLEHLRNNLLIPPASFSFFQLHCFENRGALYVCTSYARITMPSMSCSWRSLVQHTCTLRRHLDSPLCDSGALCVDKGCSTC